MRVLRLQNMTPDIYTAESRDFQILCRIADCLYNGVKFDIDAMLKVLDTQLCREEMLNLLQTKLGFFTNKTLTATQLRYALMTFPILIRNKGSMSAVLGAVSTFLHMLGVKSEIKAWVTTDDINVNGNIIKNHTVIIGIGTTLADTTMLDELFRYILPAGFEYYIYFYTKLATDEIFNLQDNVKLIFISNKLNSTVNNHNLVAESDTPGRVVQSFDTMQLINKQDAVNIEYRFRGLSKPTDDVKTNDIYVQLGSDPGIEYVYSGSSWVKYTYHGLMNNIPSGTQFDTNSIISVELPNIYKYYFNGNLIDATYRGKYLSTDKVSSPQVNDVMESSRNSGEFFIYTPNSTWESANYLGSVEADEAVAATDLNLVRIKSVINYVWSGTVWSMTDIPIYIYMADNEVRK